MIRYKTLINVSLAYTHKMEITAICFSFCRLLMSYFSLTTILPHDLMVF
jgi:hypothetical protein